MSEQLGLLFLIAAVVFAYLYATTKMRISRQVQTEIVHWRERELDSQKRQLLDLARTEARLELEQWKVTHEAAFRQDAIQRSQAVTIGKVTEHIVPYFPGFAFNPKDVRFLGTPIDFVVFDGLSDGRVDKIVFVEVKTGGSTLSSRERLVREAVAGRKVEWVEFRPTPAYPATAAVAQVPSVPSATGPAPRKKWWQ